MYYSSILTEFQYTASGFLDSLIFNDEVDSYQTWASSLSLDSLMHFADISM